MLLRDYAITPDVFDETSYAHPAACDAELRSLKEVLVTEGLVRDLRLGEWGRVFRRDGRSWHQRGKELLKKLAQQNRLVAFPPALAITPSDDRAWCEEALATHLGSPLGGGVIVTEAVKAAYPTEPVVQRIDRLTSAPWWTSRSPSVALRSTFAEYRSHLAPVLRCATSLMFIDPHLDPARRGYSEFAELVVAAGNRDPAPAIEIHRVCYEGSGPNRRFPMSSGDSKYFERRFRESLEVPIRGAGLRVEVFIWDHFHDRFLITNLIGISLSNGFDTSTDPSMTSQWNRLGRRNRDYRQREFDPASERHRLRHRFVIG